MFWFLLFAGVTVVWIAVLTLLVRRTGRRARGLAAEVAAAQDKLEAAQSAPERSA